MYPVTTAVIAVAGWGTRWLPITKAIEKCMLPVGNRPAVDWIVADCVHAGISRIIFIIGKDHQQIQHYYSHHAALEKYLTEKNKTVELEAVRQPQYENVTFDFIVQPPEQYGTAIPVALATKSIEPNEAFLFLNGDDFIYRPDGGSEITDLIATWQKSGTESALMVKEVPAEAATKYGVVITNDQDEFAYIHEKPPLDVAQKISQPCINLGKYIISPQIAHLTVEYVAKPSSNADGEYYITDIFGQAAAAGKKIAVHYIKGEHLDAGTPKNWLATNERVMSQ